MRTLVMLVLFQRSRCLSVGRGVPSSLAWCGERYAAEVETAVSAVVRACGVASRLQEELDLAEAGFSKDDLSPVTVADIAVQAIVISALRDRFPRDSFVAEESASDMSALRGPRLGALSCRRAWVPRDGEEATAVPLEGWRGARAASERFDRRRRRPA